MVAGLAIIVTLILMVALRSLLLPLVTVAFNLLTVAATFGILTLQQRATTRFSAARATSTRCR